MRCQKDAVPSNNRVKTLMIDAVCADKEGSSSHITCENKRAPEKLKEEDIWELNPSPTSEHKKKKLSLATCRSAHLQFLFIEKKL
jgi:hypothetical protein